MSLKRLGPALVPLGTPACPVGLAPAGGPWHSAQLRGRTICNHAGERSAAWFQRDPFDLRPGVPHVWLCSPGCQHVSRTGGHAGGHGMVLGGPHRLFLPHATFSIIHTDVNREVTHSFMPLLHKVRIRVSSIALVPSGARCRGGMKLCRDRGHAGNKGAILNACIGEAGSWRLSVSDWFLVWG